ncbi:cupin domain-containing protein [Parasporobacterium paucivorans]|uniref:Cupin domain-containing protein n=1 Tax=Parasporobacterium paucivorans DSM 15970 TaxID=1122934 RepID=A0A1M6GYF4_9FIRM|nr:cupin domain-containing protein [Parasporobacterium paucivorans]SHJ14946.1 Cupin domain-containing protein [Parasporobacterium paucivorans DSM 15970]
MIKRREDLTAIPRNIQGGNGEVMMIPFLTQEEFRGKGRVFSKMILKPGVSIGNHLHEGDFEGYYILKGKGKIIDNGREAEVYEGDFALTDDGESHALINDTQEDLEIIALLLYI